jgi:hypothetical protein
MGTMHFQVDGYLEKLPNIATSFQGLQYIFVIIALAFAAVICVHIPQCVSFSPCSILICSCQLRVHLAMYQKLAPPLQILTYTWGGAVSDVGVDGLVKPHQQTKINLKSTNHQGA